MDRHVPFGDEHQPEEWPARRAFDRHPPLMVTERRHRLWRQCDDAALLVLWHREDPRAVEALQLVADRERRGLEIDVLPRESEQFRLQEPDV